MGAKNTKEASGQANAAVAAGGQTATSSTAAAAADGTKKSALQEYAEFRDDLMSFSLGEAAYDYAKRLVDQQPDNPALLALFGETAWLYEKVKNPTRREHWVDRMEVLQGGIDATRKCIRANPDYVPCLRVYTMLMSKASEQKYWFKLLQPFGPIEHYAAIMNRGQQCVALDPSCKDVMNLMAQVSARCGSNTKRFWTPYTLYARYKGLPPQEELFKTAEALHLRVAEMDPTNVENACRLAMIYYEQGNFERAKRWYQKTRDELVCEDPAMEIYQTIAHTHLSTHIARNGNWNLPFG